MRCLRGRLSGIGVPQYMIDLPGGGGKIELVPDYIVSRTDSPRGEIVRFRNWAGETFDFVDVDDDRSP
jgi:lysine 2,3-aminomutase